MIVGGTAGYSSQSQTALSGWATINNQLALSRTVVYQLEASFRSDPQRKNLQTFLLRTGAFVQLNKEWSLGAGYCLIDNRKTISGTTGYAPEHEALEQVWFMHSLYVGWGQHPYKTFLRQRLRLENRFLPNMIADNNTLKRTGSSFANRLRYQLREQIPLVAVTGELVKGPYLIVQNELFFNVSGQRYVNGKIFDQNRSLVASGYRFNRSIDLELSYMLRVIKDAGNGWSRENLIQVTGFTRL